MLFRSLLILTLFAINSVSAQAIASAQSSKSASANSENGLTARIDINLDGVTLDNALRSIARQANLIATFGYRVTESSKRVTLRESGITADAAFRKALRGTDITFALTRTGHVLFTRAEQGSTRNAQGNISGKVTDAKSGKGITGASVSVDGDTHGAGIVTGEDGSYKLANVSTGGHTITVRLVGYAKQTRTVMVGEGVTVSADFKLEPTASVLDQIVVTGTVVATELKAVPSAITVITAKQIEERGITRIDQLFRGDIPGLFAINQGSNVQLDEVTMFSRGATALMDQNGSSSSAGTTKGTNPIKTYIDGVEMADSKYLSQIDPNSIERIEILTGPQASTIYGANAINGVMQIFTKRGSTAKPQLMLALTSGLAQNNFSSHLAPEYVTDGSVSGTEGRWSYHVGGSWNYIGSWSPSNQTQRYSVDGGGRMDMGKLTADLSARQGITKNRQGGNAQQTFSDLQAAGVREWSSGFARPSYTIQSLVGRTLSLTLSYRPYSWWSHEAGLGSDIASSGSIKPTPILVSPSDSALSIGQTTTFRLSRRYSTTIQLPLFSWARINLTMGGDHWNTKGFFWNVIPPSLSGNLPGFPSWDRKKPGENSGAYMQGQLGITDALFLTYGVRQDWNPSVGDEAKVRPTRYGVSYTRDVGLLSAKLRGSYGKSIRPPADALKQKVAGCAVLKCQQFGFYDVQFANPELGSEFQQGGEGGIELYLGSRASLVVTRYNQTVEGLIASVSRVDSVPSLTPVFPTTTSCERNVSGDFTFDAAGHCFAYISQYLNVGSIRNQGWETQGSVNVGPFTTRGTYSWTKSRIIGITPRYRALLTDTQYQPGLAATYVPEHTWALGITYSRASSTVVLSVNGTGTLYKIGTNSDVLSLAASTSSIRLTSSQPRIGLPTGYRPLGSGYATADLNATHRFSSRIDALLQVSNLTNYYQNDFNIQYATLGRQSRAGVRMRW